MHRNQPILTLHQGSADDDLAACTERATDALNELVARLPPADPLGRAVSILAQALAGRLQRLPRQRAAP